MNCNSIGEQVAQALSTLPEWNCLEEFVTSFQVLWLKLGQTLQQQLVQQKIEETEAHYQGAKTKRRKRPSKKPGDTRGDTSKRISSHTKIPWRI